MNTILFDLDGTLLPMEMDTFTKGYFTALAKKCVPMGFDPERLTKAVWAGTKAMVENDGTKTNEERFWETFADLLGDKVLALKGEFEDFYTHEFHEAKAYTKENPLAKEALRIVKEKGYQVVLATNPIFPASGTKSRLEWIGLSPEEFSMVTTYENSVHCKPNLAYYRDILNQIGKEPRDCLMVGNDAVEDLCAEKLGMEVYLVTDTLYNPHHVDISMVNKGSFQNLIAYLFSLPDLKKEK
jgi:FMN phosphatase YigB (HAD superfamily)